MLLLSTVKRKVHEIEDEGRVAKPSASRVRVVAVSRGELPANVDSKTRQRAQINDTLAQRGLLVHSSLQI
jgi:hypothetical protein